MTRLIAIVFLLALAFVLFRYRTNEKVQKGVVIAEVQPESAAEKAGLKAGDVIIAIDGDFVESSSQLRNEIGQRKIGQKMKVKILRDGKTKVIRAKVGDAVNRVASQTEIHPLLEGATLAQNDKGGVEVSNVERGSAAANSGLRPGDIILSANRYKVDSLDTLRKIAKTSGDRLVLRLKRGNAALYLVLQ